MTVLVALAIRNAMKTDSTTNAMLKSITIITLNRCGKVKRVLTTKLSLVKVLRAKFFLCVAYVKNMKSSFYNQYFEPVKCNIGRAYIALFQQIPTHIISDI